MPNVIKNFGLDTQLISSVIGKFKQILWIILQGG